MNLSKSSLKDVLYNVKHSDVFLRNIGIDVINDRGKMLTEILEENKIDKKSTLATLKLLTEVDDGDAYWLLQPPASLINHIKNKYHNHHRVQLPMLISLAKEVEFKNSEHPSCPVGLSNYLTELYRNLLMHMEKEEQILFPFLSEGKRTYVFTQISLAMHNHDYEIDMLNKTDEITNDFTLPEDADGKWKKLYGEFYAFKMDLLRHIKLENDILFEKFN